MNDTDPRDELHNMPGWVRHVMQLADAAAEQSKPAPEPKPRGNGTWYVWRLTDPEPGDAPEWEHLTTGERRRWLDDLAELPEAPAAWGGICRWVARTFPGCHAMRTPAETALTLIAHTLPWGKGEPHPYRYPTLPDGLRRLIAATSTQHRMEITTIPCTTMRRYVSYDARVAFGAYLRRLPTVPDGGVMHDHEPKYEKYQPGRYLVDLTVPPAWSRIGLAPRQLADGAGWDWPSRPGESWQTWLDECELRLVDEWRWPYAVRERILFAVAGVRGGDPLREYAERMTAELERIERYPRSAGVRCYRAGLRALTIHPVGAWHRGGGIETRHIESLDELTPDDALADIVRGGGGGYMVSNRVDLSAFRSRWWRPEWSSAVYARERVTATRKALEIPRDRLLAIRGDAIHMADYDPEWSDTGKVGSYRPQAVRLFTSARKAPTSQRDLEILRKEAEDGGQGSK
jgi:hypothetical protein